MDLNSTAKNSVNIRSSYAITFPLCIIGILSNVVLAVTIITSRRLRNPTYLLIANMGVSNTLLCFIIALMNFRDNAKALVSIYVNNVLCKILHEIITSCYVISHFSLTLISLYRLEMVIKSNKKQILSPILKRHKLTILAIWPLGFFICVPILYIMKYSQDNLMCDVCMACGQIINVLYYVSLFCIVYTVPAIIMLVTFIQIGKNIRMTGDAIIFKSRLNVASNQRANSAIKFLSIATGIYMLFSWPLLMLTVVISIMGTTITKLYETSVTAPALITAAYISSFMVNVINPFLYLGYDKNIRGRLRTIYRKKFSRRFHRNFVK